MEKVMALLQVIAPIFAAVGLGVYSRRRNVLTAEQVEGLQQYVMKFGLPCVLFNSCLGANLGSEAVLSMALAVPMMLGSALLGFRLRKKKFSYHNLPQLFAAQESGMLGIPLFIALFGISEAYRMGVLDLAQSIIAIPVIAILSAATGKNPSPLEIAGKVIRSPFLLSSLAGLALNLSGIAGVLDHAGVLGVITETTAFLAQPVSAVMLFGVGYNFSLNREYRTAIFRVASLHFALFVLLCGVMQGALFLAPGVEAGTRWAVLLFCLLPPSYLAPSLGRSEEDRTIASGVCSLLTVTCLIAFCVMAVCSV